MTINAHEGPKLLSLAVHEFRTPVTVVAGYIRMLLKMNGGALGDQQRKLLEEAEKSCGRLSGLLAELSELGNMQSGQIRLDRRDVDLFKTLEEVAESVHEGTDRGVRLELHKPDKAALVNADPKRLADALNTLMTATLRERAEPGVVVVAGGVEGQNDSRVAYITVGPSDGSATSSRFQTSDWVPFERWRGGLGFRLLLADEIICAHGGTLFSGQGQGQRARGTLALTLPVKE